MSKISAIICTHNREKYLGAAIDSLLAQDFPDYEIIVVDNASSDRTREIVQARPSVKYVYEQITGLSVARNTGAKSATSQILAYLDDDAVANPNWLSVLYAAYQSNEKLAIAGGKVTLIWPEGILPPTWLSDDLAGNLGAYNLGDKIVYIDRPGLTPRGLNYSIRRKFLEEIGGFDVNLGRVGKKLLSNEELLMTEQALNRGWQVAYIPEALVQHNVSPERVNRQWFLSRGWWQGISEYYREQLVGKAGVKQLGRGGERLMYGVYKSMKYFRHPDRRFENLVYSYGQIGYLSAVIMGLFSAAKREK
ncbi:glycosyltransferase family 2 protein [Phormidium sp. LEGE 05292]|uniref:glycosyltransferase family 2 protein n=1 Tax=[Phormidium] sp. LEGE 05292 TaxID=767427 RepID=UPI00187EF0CA|nr:glycosyltransferase family 2 protein [Phormidium sp. LEGE 05292]MBE9223967.1 glycosyltransferase family 2 protein [Phormidium sp. LEGE 05292]